MTQSRLEATLHHVETMHLERFGMLSSTCLKELYDDPFGADLAEDFMALFG